MRTFYQQAYDKQFTDRIAQLEKEVDRLKRRIKIKDEKNDALTEMISDARNRYPWMTID